MQTTTTFRLHFIVLFAVLVVAFLLNLSIGSVSIPINEIIAVFTGSGSSNDNWQYILVDYRLPKAITAMIAGGGLAISGLLMQTLFRNPLAGPFVLGLSSGASLGVAFVILGAGAFGGAIGGFLLSQWGVVIAAGLGSFLVLLAVLAVTFRVKDTMAILIIGLMFGSLTTSVVSVLSYFSNAERLQQYIFWSFGSLGNQTWQGVSILSICFLLGLLLSISSSKSLNSLLLGENYAKSMGLQIKKTTFIIILATSILAGGITAFVGPIAFVGLAVPHLVRQFFKTSNHLVLMPAVLLFGSMLMLVCDTIARLPFNAFALPINAITSLIGAPIVIWLLVRKRKLFF
ncbi:MAG TPA: iron ABC transporter permease [Aequorivita sp.]|nr:iron ABC transporter permease [Aequorivita sp.]